MLNRKQVEKVAQEYFDNIPAADMLSNFAYTVTVNHFDGTTLVFTHAFAVKHQEYLFIYTEHNGHHIFFEEDLARFGCFKPVTIPEIP